MQNAAHPDLGGGIVGCRGADPRSRLVSGGFTTSAAVSVVAGARKRLVHDLADRAGAPAALRATAEAAVDLSGRAGRRRRFDCRPHVVVGQHVAGADNHLRVPGFHPELC